MWQQRGAWRSLLSLLAPRLQWSSTAPWPPAPQRGPMAWARGQQPRPWPCLCWRAWASSVTTITTTTTTRGLKAEPPTSSWLYNPSLVPDDEPGHCVPGMAHTHQQGAPEEEQGKRNLANPKSPNTWTAACFLFSSPFFYNRQWSHVAEAWSLAASLLGIDWDNWESLLFTLP